MSHLQIWIPFGPSLFLRRLGGLAALVLALLTLACSGGGRRDPAGALRVANAGTRSMSSLYVKPITISDWGPNQLGSQPLGPGGALTLTPMSPDLYDVSAIFTDGVEDAVTDVRVVDGETTVLPMTNVGQVTVVNTISLWITEIYLVPHSATGWGIDQLSGTLQQGESFTLTDVTAGSYDLRVVFLGGSLQDYTNIPVTPATTYTVQVQ